MTNKLIFSYVVLALLLLAGGAAYYYYVVVGAPGAASLPPAAVPDNSVVAGPVTAISSTSITVKKQDGVLTTLGITEETMVVMAGEGGQAGTPKEAGDIKTGMMVLITPTQSGGAAQSIVLLLAPPAQ